MLADPRLLRPAVRDTSRGDEPILLLAARGSAALPPASGTRRDDGRAAQAGNELLDYADFVLDQEARYCQQ